MNKVLSSINTVMTKDCAFLFWKRKAWEHWCCN